MNSPDYKQPNRSPNRIVNVRRLRRLGCEKLQSGFALCAILSTPKFFMPVKYFVFSLSVIKNLRLQPERYVPFA